MSLFNEKTCYTDSLEKVWARHSSNALKLIDTVQKKKKPLRDVSILDQHWQKCCKHTTVQGATLFDMYF